MLEDKKWSLGGGIGSDRVVREGLFARVPLIRGLKVIIEQTMLDIYSLQFCKYHQDFFFFTMKVHIYFR